MCARCRKPFIVLSIALMAIIAAVWVMSYWKTAGWFKYDEAWVLPGSGMQELHVTERRWLVHTGDFAFSRHDFLRAVIPAGSSAAGEPRHELNWVWQPILVRVMSVQGESWKDRWYVSKWNNWRFGDFGWYATGPAGATSRVFSLPLWMLMALVGTPCWLALGRAARTLRRRRRGQCVRCGYNRRGLATDSPCPECGTGAGTAA
jgi:hypothetical protein